MFEVISKVANLGMDANNKLLMEDSIGIHPQVVFSIRHNCMLVPIQRFTCLIKRLRTCEYLPTRGDFHKSLRNYSKLELKIRNYEPQS